MTPREQAVLTAAIKVNESVRSMGGPDDRLFLEAGPLEDLATALDELKEEQEQAPMGRGGGEQYERTTPVSGDPKVLSPLKAAYLASDKEHTSIRIRNAWQFETRGYLEASPVDIDAEIRAWTPPAADPSLADRVDDLGNEYREFHRQTVSAVESLTNSVMELEAKHDQLIQDITTGFMKVDRRIRKITHPEPTAPDDPVCATCGHERVFHGIVRGCYPQGGCGCDRFAEPVPAAPPAELVLDPVRVEAALEEIVTQAYLYGSARYSQGVAVAKSRNVGAATDRMIAEWNKLESMVRTIALGVTS